MSYYIKNILKIILYIAIVVAIGTVIVVAFNRNKYLENNDDNFESEYPKSYAILEMILENDESYYDDELLEEYRNSEDENIDSLDKKYPGYADFIKGMYSVHQSSSTNGADYLNAALKELELPYYKTYYDSTTLMNDLPQKRISELSTLTQKIGARAYYELARICVTMKHFDAVDDYYELMNSTLDKETCINEYVYLNTWASYDVGEMSGGAEKAVEILENLYDVATKYNYDEPEAILMSLADAYETVGNTVKFVNTELEALKIVKEKEDIYDQVLINSSIGLEYMDEFNYDKALIYMGNAYNLEYTDDSDTEAYLKTYICSNLALIYIRTGEYTTALKYIDEAEEYREKQNDESSERDDAANILTLRAEYEIAEGDPNKAIDYLNQALEIFENATSFSYSNFEMELDILYGEAYLKLNNGEKALQYYKLAEAECVSTGVDTDSRCYQGLFYANKLLGNNGDAFSYAEKYAEALSNEIYNSQENEASYLLEEFQSDEKDSQISELSTKSRLYSLAIILSVVIVIFIVFGLYGNVKNSRKIKKLNSELLELSEKDGLTGIYNRRKLDTYLSENWYKILELSKTVGVAMIDVDNFKLYNDFYGHQMGDGALISVSNVLKSVTSRKLEDLSDSFVARYGGEEFVLIIPGQTKTTMDMILTNIRIQMENLDIPHTKSDVSDIVTLSIGFTVVDCRKSVASAAISYETAISIADSALYEAKKERNTCRYRD